MITVNSGLKPLVDCSFGTVGERKLIKSARTGGRILEAIEERLRADIDERESAFANELQLKEDAQIDAKWRELNEDQRFVRVNAEQKARQQTFETLRQVNDGG